MAPEVSYTAVPATHHNTSLDHLDLDGTITDFDPDRLNQLFLPVAVPQGGTAQASSEVAWHLDKLKSNANLLTTEEFEHWKAHIDANSREVAALQAAGDTVAANHILEELSARMRSLSEFFDVERSQGLVATHAETGIRIYVDRNRGSVWFCTPDERAFDYQTRKDAIQDLVKCIRGDATISHTDYQEQTVDGSKHLLGCRLDELKLGASDSFTIETHVRTNIVSVAYNTDSEPSLQSKQVTFTLADLTAGGNPAVNGAGGDPAVNGADGTQPGVTTPRSELPQPESISPGEAAGVSGATINADRAARAARAALPGAQVESPPVVKQQEQFKKLIEEQRARLGATATTADEAAKVLTEIETHTAKLDPAVKGRIAYLEGKLKNAVTGLPETVALETELKGLRTIKTDSLIRQCELLETKMTSADVLVRNDAKLRYLALSDEFKTAYDQKIALASEGERATLKARKLAVTQTADDCLKEAAGWFKNGLAKFSPISEWIGRKLNVKIPGFFTWLEAREARAASTALKTLQETTHITQVSALESAVLAKHFGELDSSVTTFSSRIQTLERNYSRAPSAELQAEIETLKDARAKCILRQKDILERQIVECGNDSAKAAKLKTKLYSELGDKIDGAYHQLKEAMDPVAQARARVRLADSALAAATDTSPLGQAQRTMLENTASYERARLSLEEADSTLRTLEQQAGGDLSKIDPRARATAVAAQNTALEQVASKEWKLTASRRRALRLEASEIQKQLTTGIPADQKASLAAQLDSLQQEISNVETQYSNHQRAVIRFASQSANSGLIAELETAQKNLAAEIRTGNDLKKRTQLEQKVAGLEQKLATNCRASLQTELDNIQALHNTKTTQLGELQTRLGGVDPASPEAGVIKGRIQTVEADIALAESQKITVTKMQEVQTLRHKMAPSLAQRARLEGDLAQLVDLEATGKTLSKADAARKTALTQQIDALNQQTAQLQQLEGEIAARVANDPTRAARSSVNIAEGEAASFRSQLEQHRADAMVEASRSHLPFLDPVQQATRDLRAAESTLAKATKGVTAAEQAKYTVLEQKVLLERARLAAIQESERLAVFRNQLALDSKNSDLAARVVSCEEALAKATEAVGRKELTVSFARRSALAIELSEVDAKITPGLPKDQRAALVSQKDKLLGELTSLETEISKQQRTLIQGASEVATSQLKTQLAELQAKLKTETNATTRGTLEQQIAQLEKDVASRIERGLQTQIDNLALLKTTKAASIAEIEARLRTVATDSAEATTLKTTRKGLLKEIAAIDHQAGTLNQLKEIQTLKSQVAAHRAARPHLVAELDQIIAAERSGTLTPAQTARKAQITADLDAFGTNRARLDRLTTSFQARVRAATQNAGNLLSQIRNADYNPFSQSSAWHTRIDRPGQFMQKHPLASAWVAASLTEAFSAATMADVSPDAVHTPLPGLLYAFERPLGDWVEEYKFTTQEKGAGWSRVADVTSRVGDATIVIGGIAATIKLGHGMHALGAWGVKVTPGATALANSRFVASIGARTGFIGTGGKILLTSPVTAHALSAVYGYMQFSDLENWENDTDTQLAGRTASPILMGAAGGSFFGPPGAAVGALAGAIGEGIGVTHALVKLDYKLDSQWKERGVRDSICRGLTGFVYPKDDPRVTGRSPELTTEEENVIQDFTKQLTLKRMFGLIPGHTKDKLTNEQLSDLGFIVPNPKWEDPNYTLSPFEQKQCQATGQHNWARLVELMDNVEDNYNPFTTWTYLMQAQKACPDAAQAFIQIKNTCYNEFVDVYRRSQQVTYTNHDAHWTVTHAAVDILNTHWARPPIMYFTQIKLDRGGTVVPQDEMKKRFAEIAAEFRKQFDAREAAAKTPEERKQLAEEQWAFFYKLNSVSETNPQTGETRQLLLPDKENSRYPELERILAVPEHRLAFFNMYEWQSGNTDATRKPLSGYAMFTNMADCRTGQFMLGGVMSDTFATQSADEAIKALANLDVDALAEQMSGIQ